MRDMASQSARWMETLPGEIRQVCRQLARAPGFALMVIVMMAAGIGVSIAIFSIVRNVLLRPLPYRDPSTLVQVISMSRKSGDSYGFGWAPLRDAYDW